MMIEVLKRMTTGIAIGGIFTFIVLSFIKFYEVEASVQEIWLGMLGSLVIGIYFGLSSFIFEVNEWSFLKQTFIHFILSIVIYNIVALSTGWVPFRLSAIVLSGLVWILIYTLVWVSFYQYFKKVEASLNEELQKKN